MQPNWTIFSNKSIQKNELPDIEIYFTSEENAYGITDTYWVDGEVLMFTLSDRQNIRIILKEEKYIYEQRKLNCRSEFYYHCFGTLLTQVNFSVCPKTCLPFSIPNEVQDVSNLPELCPLNPEEEERMCFDKRVWLQNP